MAFSVWGQIILLPARSRTTAKLAIPPQFHVITLTPQIIQQTKDFYIVFYYSLMLITGHMHPHLQQNYTGHETTPCWNIEFWSFLSKTKRV